MNLIPVFGVRKIRRGGESDICEGDQALNNGCTKRTSTLTAVNFGISPERLNLDYTCAIHTRPKFPFVDYIGTKENAHGSDATDFHISPMQ